MAGKRTATTDLNHTNWNHEEEREEAGTFSKAPEAVLQKRVIKTAKRRNPISSVSSNADGANKSVFGSFTGFTKSAPTSTAFGFLNNLSKPQEDEPKSNGLSAKSNSSKHSGTSHTSLMFKAPEPKRSKSCEKEDEYYAKLKGLNESVSNWIKKHVDTNPFLNLKPIFKDYEKYFDELEKIRTDSSEIKKPQSNTFSVKNSEQNAYSPSTQKELSSFVFQPTSKSSVTVGSSQVAVPQFSFGSSVDTKKVDDTQSAVGATKVSSTSPAFALPASSAKSEVAKETQKIGFGTGGATTSTPTFSFGTAAQPTSGFSFGGSNTAPFTFANVSKPQSTEESKEKVSDEEYEPPKARFTPVVEDGHIYTIRCKVFVKKDNTFGERGVGNLYLKPVPNSEKVQVIVRADTNLGNLLCNFILSDLIPMKRMGKKDVMLVCLPTPDSKPPPTPILLRVKSTEEADELLTVLEKHKK